MIGGFGPSSVVRLFEDRVMREVLDDLERAARACVDAPVWSLPDGDVLAGLDRLQVVEQQVALVKARLVGQVQTRRLPAAQHATSTVVWLRERFRVSVHAAKRLVELARAVDTRPGLDAAVAAGQVNAEQAVVIAAALAELPAQAGPAVVDEAERLLVGFAGQFEPVSLRKLGARILAHVDPEAADAADAAALARQQARAQRQRTLALTDTGDGRVRLTGWLDAEAAAIVHAALDPLCRPLPADQRTPGQRRADALAEICQLVLAGGQLPDNGGDRPQLVVTVPFDVLRAQLGRAQLDTGASITPAQVRRLACDAAIIPAVLGGDGETLDLGRQRRLFTGAARRALVLRDRGCAFPGCDRPPRWCHAHHVTAWTAGGTTAPGNGVLLCGHHHRLIHHSHWTVRIAADGQPEFTPPAYIDPQRRPRRNTYHRRT
jgi:hypothetical protein